MIPRPPHVSGQVAASGQECSCDPNPSGTVTVTLSSASFQQLVRRAILEEVNSLIGADDEPGVKMGSNPKAIHHTAADDISVPPPPQEPYELVSYRLGPQNPLPKTGGRNQKNHGPSDDLEGVEMAVEDGPPNVDLEGSRSFWKDSFIVPWLGGVLLGCWPFAAALSFHVTQRNNIEGLANSSLIGR